MDCDASSVAESSIATEIDIADLDDFDSDNSLSDYDDDNDDDEAPGTLASIFIRLHQHAPTALFSLTLESQRR